MAELQARRKQWCLVLAFSDAELAKFKAGDSTAELDSYRIENIGPDGKRRFYLAENGNYGEPLLVAEPDLGLDVPLNLDFVNAKGEAATPKYKLTGVICQGSHRASLTKLQDQKIGVAINADGSVQIGDEVWWISTLFLKDAQRVRGYDGYLVRVKPDKVRILELGDLDLF